MYTMPFKYKRMKLNKFTEHMTLFSFIQGRSVGRWCGRENKERRKAKNLCRIQATAIILTPCVC